MGRYRVNVECSQKLPQTKSEYFTHCSYEVQAISKGVAKQRPWSRTKPGQSTGAVPARPTAWRC